jgi:hypothetical protein
VFSPHEPTCTWYRLARRPVRTTEIWTAPSPTDLPYFEVVRTCRRISNRLRQTWRKPRTAIRPRTSLCCGAQVSAWLTFAKLLVAAAVIRCNIQIGHLQLRPMLVRARANRQSHTHHKSEEQDYLTSITIITQLQTTSQLRTRAETTCACSRETQACIVIEPYSLPPSKLHLVQVLIRHTQWHEILPYTIHRKPLSTPIRLHDHNLPIRLGRIIVNRRLIYEPILGR